LNDEHAERRFVVKQRYAQKRVKTFFAGLGKIPVARVRQRVHHHYRLHALDYQTG
jgi:hypothetical protein